MFETEIKVHNLVRFGISNASNENYYGIIQHEIGDDEIRFVDEKSFENSEVILTTHFDVFYKRVPLKRDKFYILINFERHPCFQYYPRDVNILNIGYFNSDSDSVYYPIWMVNEYKYNSFENQDFVKNNFEDRRNNGICSCYRRYDSRRETILNWYKPHRFNTGAGYTMDDFLENKKSIMEQYLFYMAIENGDQPFYVTEKLYEGVLSGCIPIYWGGNISQYTPFNPERIINIHKGFNDFKKVDVLTDYSDSELEEKFNLPLLIPDWKDFMNNLRNKFKLAFLSKFIKFKKTV